MKKSISTHVLSLILASSTALPVATFDLLNPSVAVAQNQNLKGTIVDEKGEVIIGATVLIKGRPGAGTTTNFDGQFTLAAKAGDVLEISYVGYKTTTIAYKGEKILKVVLKEDSEQLSEVVVTALGIKRQTKALAYNAQELKGDLIAQGKDSNFLSGLNGKVAGVTINHSSAGAGSAARVVMRGSKSIEGSNNALYVIDGVPLLNVQGDQGSGKFSSGGATDAAADINPDDIASVTVLSGASAAALYGSAAANGAILITTKKGQEGTLSVGYQMTGEWGKAMILPKFQNRYGSNGSLESWGTLLPEDHPRYNVSDFLQTAHTQTHSVSLSGGTAKNQTYVSGSFTNNNGLVPNNKYQRYNLNVRNSSSLLDDKFKIDAGINYVKEYHRNMINQGEYANPIVAAYLMPRSETMQNVRNYESFDVNRNIWTQNWVYGKGDYTLQNPYWQAYRNLRETNRERYVLSLAASYELMKWKDGETWTIATRGNYDKINFVDTDKRFASTEAVLDVSSNGYYGQGIGKSSQVYLDLISTINKNIDIWGDNYLSINASVGGSLQDNRYDNQSIGGPLREKGYPNLFNIFNIDKAAAKTKIIPSGWNEQTQSVFASAEFGFNSYLFLTLTGRNDWASQLANSPKNSFFYPSVGLSGVVTEMLSDNLRTAIRPYLGYLKVRAAYASVANPFPRGLTTPTYNPDGKSGEYNGLTHYPVSELLPERTDSYEVGISSRWFGGVLNLDATIYRTYTRNQTINPTISSSSGYSSMYIQTGEVRNQGVEVSAGLNFGNRDSWFYNSNFTFSINENTITKLGVEFKVPVTGEIKKLNEVPKGGLGTVSYVLKEGGSLGDIYSTKSIRRDIYGNPYVGVDGNLEFTDLAGDDRIFLGSVLPKANYGWSNEIGYKNFSIGALLTARTGGVVVSMTQAALDHYGVSERSAEARDNGAVVIGNSIIGAENYYKSIGKNGVGQYFTYDASNVRIAEAHISYKLDRKYLLNVADITMSLVGRNLGFLYNKAPFDPESISSTGNYSQGLDYFMMPTQRTLGFSFKVTF